MDATAWLVTVAGGALIAAVNAYFFARRRVDGHGRKARPRRIVVK